MIYLVYVEDYDLEIYERFFFYCDVTKKQLDYYNIDDSLHLKIRNEKFLGEEWARYIFKEDYILVNLSIDKLPTTVKQFKKICKESLPEVFL